MTHQSSLLCEGRAEIEDMQGEEGDDEEEFQAEPLGFPAYLWVSGSRRGVDWGRTVRESRLKMKRWRLSWNFEE